MFTALPISAGAAETDENTVSIIDDVEVASATQEATEQSLSESAAAVESGKEETIYKGEMKWINKKEKQRYPV